MFIKIIHNIYFKIKKREIKKGKYKLRRIKIDTVLRILIKNCEEKGIEYKVLEKDHESLIVYLKGNKERILFKYHKTDMVFKESYKEFINNMNDMKNEFINKGVYITTGVFEEQLHKYTNRSGVVKKILLEDYCYFMKSQLGMKGKTNDIFKNRKINFYKYLPR